MKGKDKIKKIQRKMKAQKTNQKALADINYNKKGLHFKILFDSVEEYHKVLPLIISL